MNRGDMPFLGVYDNVRYCPSRVSPFREAQETEQRRGDHLPILLPHEEQQDETLRTCQAQDAGTCTLCLD